MTTAHTVGLRNGPASIASRSGPYSFPKIEDDAESRQAKSANFKGKPRIFEREYLNPKVLVSTGERHLNENNDIDATASL